MFLRAFGILPVENQPASGFRAAFPVDLQAVPGEDVGGNIRFNNGIRNAVETRSQFTRHWTGDGGKQIKRRQVDSFPRRDETADTAGFAGQEGKKTVLAGGTDTETVQAQSLCTGNRQYVFRPEDLPVGKNEDVRAASGQAGGRLDAGG